MLIRVFIADDHKILRDGLSAILAEQTDIEVVGCAADGRSAVKKVSEVNPDVILMDINMPQLNGIEATRKINVDNPKSQIIILSMYATKEHIFQALSAGAKGYLLKETSGLEVVEAIKTVFAGKRFLSQAITETVIEDYIEKRNISGRMDPLNNLSDRERDVFFLIVEGYSSTDIAEKLFLALSTVSTYRSRIMKKLQVKNNTDLIKFSLEHHLID